MEKKPKTVTYYDMRPQDDLSSRLTKSLKLNDDFDRLHVPDLHTKRRDYVSQLQPDIPIERRMRYKDSVDESRRVMVRLPKSQSHMNSTMYG